MFYILSIAGVSYNNALELEVNNYDSLDECKSEILNYFKIFCKNIEVEVDIINGWQTINHKSYKKQIKIYLNAVKSKGCDVKYKICNILNPSCRIE